MPSLATRLPLPFVARSRSVAGSACWRAAAAYTTATVPPGSGSDGGNVPRMPPPPRPPVEPTTFAGKAAPRDVHMRPGLRRGLPPNDPRIAKPWEKEQKERLEAQRKAFAAQGGDPRNISSTDEPRNFDGPSKPRPVYTRPNHRELPIFKNRIPTYIALAVAGVGAWGLFVLYATNQERLSSSVVRQISFQLRTSPEVGTLLGDGVRLERNWWGGDPFIHGSINLMQGRIDLKFRVDGTKEAGTLYFTSIRPQQSAPWQILRYKLVTDHGDTLRLEDQFTQTKPERTSAATAAAPQ